MKPTEEAPHSHPHRRIHVLRNLKETQKLSIKTLVFSAIVGALIGFIGIFFEIATSWIFSNRSVLVGTYVQNAWLVIPATFLLSAALAGLAFYLTHQYSPESGGSGIPEIEAALQDLRPARWWRVIPIKFIGGLGSIGSGMVLGREGPTVQLGANLGQMMSEIGGIKDKETRHTLLAAGSAAGLATAFNAPLAGILFVTEEMRSEFKYSLISIKAVFVAAITATIACRYISGSQPVLLLGNFDMPPQSSLWLFLLLGLLFGLVGVGFNALLLGLQEKFLAFYQGKLSRFVLTGAFIGGSCGVVGIYMPDLIGGGFDVVHKVSAGHVALGLLLLVFALRFLTSTISFSSGPPGGIFSPLLALGATFGALFGTAVMHLMPDSNLQVGMFVIAGMGALFAATVRAPLTGAVLVLEMTTNYSLIIPMLITCVGATIVAQILGGRPLYTVLMERILERNGIPFKRAE